MKFPSQLTPKRPLRSEVEREKRLSRPTSIIALSTNIRGNNTGDAISLSGESSNRNSIGKCSKMGIIEWKRLFELIFYFQSQPIQRPQKTIQFRLRCRPRHVKVTITVICRQSIQVQLSAKEMKIIQLSQPDGRRKDHCRLNRMALKMLRMNLSKREILV